MIGDSGLLFGPPCIGIIGLLKAKLSKANACTLNAQYWNHETKM